MTHIFFQHFHHFSHQSQEQHHTLLVLMLIIIQVIWLAMMLHLVDFTGTITIYAMTATDATFLLNSSAKYLDGALNMLFRMCVQHQMVPQTTLPADSVVLQNGCYYLKLTFFG